MPGQEDERIDIKPEEVISGEDLASLFQGDEERTVAAKLLIPLTSRINALAEARLSKRLGAQVDKLIGENKTIIERELEKLRKANTPMTAAELQALLTQEYVEFTVRLREGKNTRDFVIRELPLDIETKVLRSIQKTVSLRLQEIGTIEWAGAVTMLERVEKIVGLIPGAMETLSDVAAICLDPFGDEQIDGAWVRKNVSMPRIVQILRAQLEAGHYRDFVSGISQLTPSMIQ